MSTPNPLEPSSPLRTFEVEINGIKVRTQANDPGAALVKLVGEGQLAPNQAYMVVWQEIFPDQENLPVDDPKVVAFEVLRRMGVTPARIMQAFQELNNAGLRIVKEG